MERRDVTPKKIRVKRCQVVDLELLDQLLDQPVSAFDRTVRRLAREFRSKQVQVAVPPRDRLPALNRRTLWTGLFEAEVKRMPRMDRREEFLMARRHEFMVVDELAAAADEDGRQAGRVREVLLAADGRRASRPEALRRDCRGGSGRCPRREGHGRHVGQL